MRVASDGGVNVREEITFDFFGPFSGGYRDIPLRDGETHRPRLGRRGRRPLRAGRLDDARHPGPAGQFGAAVVDGKMRIVWRYQAINQRRTFTIRYRISGLAVAYDDVVDVNLQVWGDEWETGLGAPAGDDGRAQAGDAAQRADLRPPGRRQGRHRVRATASRTCARSTSRPSSSSRCGCCSRARC